MEKTAIRTSNSPAPANPVARNAGARQSDAADAKGGFSLLLADMAEMAGTAETPAPALPAAVAGEIEDPSARGELLPEWLAAELRPAAQPPAEPAAAALPAAALPAVAVPGTEQPAAAPAAAALPPSEWQAEAGAFSLSTLIGQTARMDGAADAALRDGRAVGVVDTDGSARQVALPMGGERAAYAGNLPAAVLASGHAGGGAQPAAGEVLADAVADVADTAAQPSTLSLNPSERGAQPHGLAALLARMDTEATPWASALAPAPTAAGGAAPVVGAAASDGSVPAVGAGGSAQAEAGGIDAAATDTAAADAVLAQPDDNWADQLSEQVAFWVQQKTQRAEMTIDRQGRPVQVQVTITGSEAHVTFRSNEQQTRDMLDAGTAQLREMLEQQGLNLASVTVQSGDAGGQGASARQDSSGRQANGRGDEGQRQTAVVSADLRARPDASRSVDLFV